MTMREFETESLSKVQRCNIKYKNIYQEVEVEKMEISS